MKPIPPFFFLLLFLVLTATLQAQPPPKLLVRGDDMGGTHASNLALMDCYKNGIERSVEVLVPAPWFPEAVRLLRDQPQVDVGVHLALTSEWENLKWRPLTFCPSLTDSNGYFFPMVWPNKNYPQAAIKIHGWKLAEIEKELRAQIELAKRLIPRISHLSTHMGFESLDPAIAVLLVRLGREYGLRVDDKLPGLEQASYQGPSGTPEEKLKSFLAMLEGLRPGKTYLFVDHPAFDGPEMAGIFHYGYEQVAKDRQGVASLWTHPRVLAKIRERQIQLISYSDLRP